MDSSGTAKRVILVFVRPGKFADRVCLAAYREQGDFLNVSDLGGGFQFSHELAVINNSPAEKLWEALR